MNAYENSPVAGRKRAVLAALFRAGAVAAGLGLAAVSGPAQTVWQINNSTNIGGNVVARMGNPQVTNTPFGSAMYFNGVNDGLIVSNNPLGGMTNLTVEMIFRPDVVTQTNAWQPRIIHIQALAVDHRLTLEARVNTNVSPQTFVQDTFLKFGGTAGYSLTLSNATFPHPVGAWTHMAITYDGTNFCNYINGHLELSGPMTGLVFNSTGSTWVGQRNNNTNYFQGEILKLRFTPRALAASEFLPLPSVPVAGTDVYARARNTGLKIRIADLLTNDSDPVYTNAAYAGLNLTTANGIVLQTNATTIFYTNAANVNDSFTYTITNCSGGSATGTVLVQVVSCADSNSLVSLLTGVPGPGSNTLILAGVPTDQYVVQYSTNLAGPWQNLSTNTAGADGLWQAVDPNATNPACFYRVLY